MTSIKRFIGAPATRTFDEDRRQRAYDAARRKYPTADRIEITFYEDAPIATVFKNRVGRVFRVQEDD